MINPKYMILNDLPVNIFVITTEYIYFILIANTQ